MAFLAALVWVLCAHGTHGTDEATNTEAPFATEGTPKIKFDRTVYDFGVTSQVEDLDGVFRYENVGSAELKVEQPAMGTSPVKTIKLQPGEKGFLPFQLSLGPARGHFEKHITIRTNDPENPIVTLTIEGEIKRVIDADPNQVNLDNFVVGSRTNFVVKIKRTDGEPLIISKVEPSARFIRITIAPVEYAKDRIRMIVEVTGEGSPRRFNEIIRLFATGTTNQPVVSVPVFGRMVGDVYVTPEAVIWGIADRQNWPNPKRGNQRTHQVSVINTRTQPLEVRNLTTDIKGLALELTTAEPGKRFEITATLFDAPEENLRGAITFETNFSSQPKLTVPIMVNVLRH